MSESVSLQEMAVFFGCDPRWITDLAKKGVVIRVGHGKYDLLQSAKNYIAFLRSKDTLRTQDTDLNPQVETARLRKEQADKIALENAARRKELMDINDVLTVMTQLQTIYNRWTESIEGGMPRDIITLVPEANLQQINDLIKQHVYRCRMAIADEIAALATAYERESISAATTEDSTLAMGGEISDSAS